MSSKVTTADVLSLSIPERLRLVEEIWDSIAEVPESIELTEAQRTILIERLEAHRRNPEAAVPWEEVRAELMKYK